MRNFAEQFPNLAGNRGNVPAGFVPAGQAQAKPDFVPAKVWLNFGYVVQETLDNGSTESTFISLKDGIALDTMPDLPVRGDSRMTFIQSARNNLRDQMLEVAATLKPGETRIVCMDANTGLAVEMRRVQDAKAPIAASDNPYSFKLALKPAA